MFLNINIAVFAAFVVLFYFHFWTWLSRVLVQTLYTVEIKKKRKYESKYPSKHDLISAVFVHALDTGYGFLNVY